MPLSKVQLRIAAKIHVDPETGCHNWTGSVNDRGYGRIYVDGLIKKAHRVAYQEMHGVIPRGMVVMHTCDNPACVNLNHLVLGTQADNVTDMTQKDRHGSPLRRGEQSDHSKLTELDVCEIYLQRWAGCTLQSIGSRFGINHSSVRKVVTGRSWRHVYEREVLANG